MSQAPAAAERKKAAAATAAKTARLAALRAQYSQFLDNDASLNAFRERSLASRATEDEKEAMRITLDTLIDNALLDGTFKNADWSEATIPMLKYEPPVTRMTY